MEGTSHSSISKILLECEENGSAPKYFVNPDTYKEKKTSLFQKNLPLRTEPVKYNSMGEEIFVVSDLHIAAGRTKAGVYRGTENFFADDSFSRFLDYANNVKESPAAILIINGDIFDFLRITEYPGKVRKVRPVKRLKRFIKFDPIKKPKKPSEEDINYEFENWSSQLEFVGISKSWQELKDDISDREMEFGLNTNDYKTIYRIIKIREGHPVFFSALSRWLQTGNKIIILKGNHDAELYWLAVRNYIRFCLADGIIITNKTTENILKEILPNVTFIDDSIEIDSTFFIEHGHRYDKFAMILDSPDLKEKPGLINIPFGSFINRYIINRVELFLPYLDNLKPTSNILPILIKENFSLAVKVLFQHAPLLIRILSTNMRYIRFMFNRVLWFFLALIIPVGLLVYFNWNKFPKLISDYSTFQKSSDIASFLTSQLQNILLILLPYLLSRFVAWMQLTEPSALNNFAEMRFTNTNYKIMTMGHTHNPGEYIFKNGRRFYNTGTWIPIIETSNAEVSENKTYTFLHLTRDAKGELQVSNNGLLQRWNDDAGRPEPLVLVESK